MSFVLYDQKLMVSDRHGRPRGGPAHEDPEDFMGMFRAIAFAIREQAAAANQMMEQLER